MWKAIHIEKKKKREIIETILGKKFLVCGRRKSGSENESGEEEKNCILITKGHKNKGLRKGQKSDFNYCLY